MRGLTRRDFLATAGVVAGLAAAGGVFNRLEPVPVFLRPPGAVDEADFLARCIRCQKCLSVCPPRIIQPLSVVESIGAAATPIIDFSRNYCDFCESDPADRPRCASACPTGALVPIEGKPTINGIAVVDKKSCIAWDWIGCTACIDACPQDAIHLDDKSRPVVDDEACDGCGLCELICPNTSLRAYGDAATGKGIVVVPFGGEAA